MHLTELVLDPHLSALFRVPHVLRRFFTLCSLAPHDDPTANLVWLPLFKGNAVPPKLDLVHGRVYCYSAADKERLLTQLAAVPGGLVEVQRTCSAGGRSTKALLAYRPNHPLVGCLTFVVVLSFVLLIHVLALAFTYKPFIFFNPR